MEFSIDKFKGYCERRNWTIDRHCSEFTIQFRICRFLEEEYPGCEIELEVNINRFQEGPNNFVKKELDIHYENKSVEGNKRVAIELKYLRDKDSMDLGMMATCKDVRFLEQLTKEIYDIGYAIVFSKVERLHIPTEQFSRIKQENQGLYKAFRLEGKIEGDLELKVGSLHEKVMLEGRYQLNWIDFTDGVKACVIRIAK